MFIYNTCNVIILWLANLSSFYAPLFLLYTIIIVWNRHVGKRPSENGELNNDVVESDNETNSIVAAMASKLAQKDKKLKKELVNADSYILLLFISNLVEFYFFV